MDLHYSQTAFPYTRFDALFHYLMDLHYSQTYIFSLLQVRKFHYLMDLHYSQTDKNGKKWYNSFTTLWIYTILKPSAPQALLGLRFTTLWIYTILKPGQGLPLEPPVSLPYGFTLFSNLIKLLCASVLFHYLMDLHYSQTKINYSIFFFSFTTLWIYTILKPQISCAHYTAQGKSTRSSTIVLWRNGIVKGAQIPIQHIEFGAHIYAHRRLAL